LAHGDGSGMARGAREREWDCPARPAWVRGFCFVFGTGRHGAGVIPATEA
jgi:hypothetical protein